MRRAYRIARDIVTAIAFLVFAGLIIARLDQGRVEHHSGNFYVNDGDTLSKGGTRYRLEGIDAPERAQSCGTGEAVWPCGEVARDALAALAGTGKVACSGSAHDRYGRLLVVCHANGRDLNAEMVRQGMAIAYGQTRVDYRREEREARADRRGVWGGAFERPQDWRRVHSGRANGDAAASDPVTRVIGWLQRLVGSWSGLTMPNEGEEQE